MATKQKKQTGSLKDGLVNGSPVTHFYYEYQGERSVAPSMLITSGVSLWQEQVYTNPRHNNSYLWEFATELLDQRQTTPFYSWVEWLRHRIWLGRIVPNQWKSSKPFPYRELLISAIYFQEARRIIGRKKSERAWHLIATAHYYLGMGAKTTIGQNAARAAKVKHDEETRRVRIIVISALERIKADDTSGSVRTISEAKELVSNLIYKKRDEDPIKAWLEAFSNTPRSNSKRKASANKVFDRIQNLLDDWARPGGPYPEISEAFASFNKRGRKAAPVVADDVEPGNPMFVGGPECFYRNINLREDGHILTGCVSVDEASE